MKVSYDMGICVSFLVPSKISCHGRFLLTITLTNTITTKVLPIVIVNRIVWWMIFTGLKSESLLAITGWKFELIVCQQPSIANVLSPVQGRSDSHSTIIHLYHFTDTTSSLSTIIFCHIHIDFLQKYAHPNGSTVRDYTYTQVTTGHNRTITRCYINGSSKWQL